MRAGGGGGGDGGGGGGGGGGGCQGQGPQSASPLCGPKPLTACLDPGRDLFFRGSTFLKL